MKIIKTNGITYLENFEGCSQWYWGTDYSCGDLYEAEEVYLAGKRFEPNRLIFVRYPDGEVFEPIPAEEYQYFGRPAYVDGNIYILYVNFKEQRIYIVQYLHEINEIAAVVDLLLSEVKDCYNLLIDGSPLMLIRQGAEDHFEVIWPEKIEFEVEARETFIYRDGDKLYFNVWEEEDIFKERTHVRDYFTGALVEKIEGTIRTMPDEQKWILE